MPIHPRELFPSHVSWARACERGKFHAYFLADRVAILGGKDTAIARTMPEFLSLEPMGLIAAMAQHTKRIGMVATASTTYDHPYHTARRFATLDHITGGRVGWNIVSGGALADAGNFGMEPMDHDTRYRRAEEYVDAVCGLWDSFDDDAFVCDRDAGVYYDPEKARAVDFQGEFVSVLGPLNVARPPQGYPVLAQAGSSGPGKALASRVGELIFAMLQSVEATRDARSELREMVAEYGREPDHVKYMPEFSVLVGRTQSEVDERLAQLDGLVDVDGLLPDLSRYFGTDLSQYPLDGPTPDPPRTAGGQTVQNVLMARAREDGVTIRTLLMEFARSHGRFHAGTPTMIADVIQEYVDADAVDGLVIKCGDIQPSLDLFVDLVVPELQRRGIFRTEYDGMTLRENLGLPWRANGLAGAPAVGA